jgi:hypothetical protein
VHQWSPLGPDQKLAAFIITAGALSDDRQHFHAGSARYLFPVRALSTVFQAKFRDGLWECYRKGELAFHGALQESASERGFAALMRAAMQDPWVVYAKRPFAGPVQVLAYLSRYTHRVAIGSGRLCALDRQRQTVTFRYKDYADHGRQKQMTLGTGEFLRRFCLHVLPPRFVKIRHYGLLGNHQLREKLAAARTALSTASHRTVPPRATAATVRHSQDAPPAPWQPYCLRCGCAQLVRVRHVLPAKILRLDSS